MKNDFDIFDYQLINTEKNQQNYFFLLMILLFIIGIIIIIFKFEFNVYEKQILIKDEDNFILIIDSTKLETYKNQKYIYINQKEYAYNVIKIDSNYSNVDGIIHQSIYITLHNYKTDAIITECHFLRSRETIYTRLVEFITGGKNGKTK